MTTFCSNVTAAVQGRLADLMFYSGAIDGVFGPSTAQAIVRFKAQHGLRARDFVGPKTLAALFAASAQPAPTPRGRLPWMDEARRHLGLREVPGPGDNPEIMGWARNLDQWYPGDDTPWCGLFVAHCMALGAPSEPQDFNRLGARAWLEFGVDAIEQERVGDASLPMGAVAVFWRTHRTRSWHGHVALVTGQNDGHVRVIGGNQDNGVSEAWFPRARLLGLRFPADSVDLIQPAPKAATGARTRSEA